MLAFCGVAAALGVLVGFALGSAVNGVPLIEPDGPARPISDYCAAALQGARADVAAADCDDDAVAYGWCPTGLEVARGR